MSSKQRSLLHILSLVFVVLLCGVTVRAAVPQAPAAQSALATARPRQTAAQPEATDIPAVPSATVSAAATPAPTAYAVNVVSHIEIEDIMPPPATPFAPAVTAATVPATAAAATATATTVPATATAAPVTLGQSPAPAATPTWSYQTDTQSVQIVRHEIKNVVYFAVDIRLSDPRQLLSAFSSDRFDGATESVEDIATRNGALLAVNGDFATFNNGGIILRNGNLYRANDSSRHLLVMDAAGDLIPYTEPPENPEEAAAQFIEEGVWQTMVFGPVLVADGEAVPLPEDFFISTGLTTEPRTAIGQIGPLHYLILVVDGRQEGYSQGVSLPRLQELFLMHGVETAFNLDGGGSTTLFFDGKIINRPGNGGQRHVSDILYLLP